MNSQVSSPLHSTLALLSLEKLLEEGLSLPDSLRRRLRVPWAELDAVVRGLEPRELLMLGQAIFRHADACRVTGPLPRAELMEFLADLGETPASGPTVDR